MDTFEDYEQLPPLKRVPDRPQEESRPSEPLILDMVECKDLEGNEAVVRRPSFLTPCYENFQLEHVKKVIDLHNLHILTIRNADPDPSKFDSQDSFNYFKHFAVKQAKLAFEQAQITSQFLKLYFESPMAIPELIHQIDDSEGLKYPDGLKE